MSNNSTFTTNTANTSQWTKPEKLALIETYKTNVHNPHSPSDSDPTNNASWYDAFRTASALLGCPERDDEAIGICWRRLKREYKGEHAKRHSTGRATPELNEIYEKMDEMFGTLPTIMAPYVYSSFTRTFTDNRASSSQARRSSVSADVQPDISTRSVATSPPPPTTTNIVPTNFPPPTTNNVAPPSAQVPPFNPTGLTSHDIEDPNALSNLFLQGRGLHEIRETIASASLAASESRNATLAAIEAHFDERMRSLDELMRTTSERRERQ